MITRTQSCGSIAEILSLGPTQPFLLPQQLPNLSQGGRRYIGSSQKFLPKRGLILADACSWQLTVALLAEHCILQVQEMQVAIPISLRIAKILALQDWQSYNQLGQIDRHEITLASAVDKRTSYMQLIEVLQRHVSSIVHASSKFVSFGFEVQRVLD